MEARIDLKPFSSEPARRQRAAYLRSDQCTRLLAWFAWLDSHVHAGTLPHAPPLGSPSPYLPAPPLAGNALRALHLILQHPEGLGGKELAALLDCDYADLRRRIVPRLKSHGVTNVRGAGYLPPRG